MYTPGVEYVLFLLPEGTLGLTSPAGAGDGAFLIRGERVASVNGAVRHAPAGARAHGGGKGGWRAVAADENFRRLVQGLVKQ